MVTPKTAWNTRCSVTVLLYAVNGMIPSPVAFGWMFAAAQPLCFAGGGGDGGTQLGFEAMIGCGVNFKSQQDPSWLSEVYIAFPNG